MARWSWCVLPLALLGTCAGASALEAPAERGLALYRGGHYAEADRYLREALERGERELGPGHPEVARALNDLANLSRDRGRYGDAEPLYRRAVAIREAVLGPDHPLVAQSLNDLAVLYRNQGRHTEAEALHERALAIRETALGAGHPDVAQTFHNLGLLRQDQGRYGEAESLLRRAAEIREKVLGPDDPELARTLKNVGSLYAIRGRYAESELIHRRALAIRETSLGPDHPDVAQSLNNLGVLYWNWGRYAEAEPLLTRAVAIREKALGPDHPEVAQSLQNLANVYRSQGRHAAAEPLHRQALASREKTFGPDHPDVAQSLHNLGLLRQDQGRYTEAQPLFEQALAIREKALGAEHPIVAQSLGTLAGLYAALGRFDEAILTIRRAADARGAWVAREMKGYEPPRRPAEAQPTDDAVLPAYVAIGFRAAEREPEQRARLLDETFQAAQLVQISDTAAAVSRAAARFATGDGALARLVREQQDRAEHWRVLDRAVVQVMSKAPAERDRAAEERLRDELTATAVRLDELAQGVAQSFPEYAELVSPDPVSVQDAQNLLADDEALLLYLETPGELGGNFLWLMSHDRSGMYRLDLAQGELAESVRDLRAGLDPGRMDGEFRDFDMAAAHALYRKLFPMDPGLLANVRHLLIVPHGSLESLPFNVLVRTAPEATGAAPGRYREADWLIRHYATTTLPSISSLRALRRFAGPSGATEPFRGIGDPVLQGHPTAGRGPAFGPLFTMRGLADPTRVRELPALPETADELRALAASVGADEHSLLLRDRATERRVKGGDLAPARVVAFSTHAGVAGELYGLAEPALVLTPPAVATEEDDGLLTASEAAQLELDADLVVLSACNTAAPDGTPGAAGLSGLAKAFIYAGSRALLVSHWYVLSNATARLTTGMFAELAREPLVGRAEALRRSMLALMADDSAPHHAHPLAWAPFVVVGEGGSPRNAVSSAVAR
ncbi:MAG TPA: tetratricopeptide repeat protein [Geminicoccaceae bacterium]|nr:tetratricopeptide repeat protein [Geminicoccaceae bacterium]